MFLRDSFFIIIKYWKIFDDVYLGWSKELPGIGIEKEIGSSGRDLERVKAASNVSGQKKMRLFNILSLIKVLFYF